MSKRKFSDVNEQNCPEHFLFELERNGSGPADNHQLSHGRGDDAVQHLGQQLLAPGGRNLPPQPAGHHRVYREELLPDLPVHRLG